MKIQALDWTMGDVGSVFVGLKGGHAGLTGETDVHPHYSYPLATKFLYRIYTEAYLSN